LGAIGDAALLLAQAGLLDGYSCAVPESLYRDFASGFPDTKISREPFCLDRDRVTCTGAMAVVDMMLGVIGDEFGLTVAEEVANQLAHNGIQSHRPTADPTRALSKQDTDKQLVKAVDLMKKHIVKPMRIIDIARQVGASERKIERLFQNEFHCSPSHRYLSLRLQKAHDLLIHSKRSISYIAYECGFYDASHFDKYYRATFHETPKRTRNCGRIA
jgi:transcriptional regulator GlxA family with amidase domain